MAKTAALVFGVIFVIAGIWGLFTDSVIGFINAVDMVSSIIHIVVGIVLLVLAGKPSVAAALKVIGILYVIFGILGLVQGETVLFGTFATDAGSNWFYLIVGIVLAVLGFSAKKGGAMPASPTPSAPQM
jgi:uncharacterized membrane protein